MRKRIELDVAMRYVKCIRGETDLSPMANDGLRRMIHDTIARRLGCTIGLVKRAAYIVEALSFPSPAYSRKYDDATTLAFFFKRHLDEIAEAMDQGDIDEVKLIAKWTFDALHPDCLDDEIRAVGKGGAE